jgi:hypothetical protein
MFGWLLLVMAIVAIAFFLMRGRSRAAAQAKQNIKPFAAKRFVADTHTCDAAKVFNGKRFLASEAPKLPLAECSDPALCRCKYRDISDRRDNDERRSIVGALSREMPIGDDRTNRRAGRERRKEDISFDYDR